MVDLVRRAKRVPSRFGFGPTVAFRNASEDGYRKLGKWLTFPAVIGNPQTHRDTHTHSQTIQGMGKSFGKITNGSGIEPGMDDDGFYRRWYHLIMGEKPIISRWLVDG